MSSFNELAIIDNFYQTSAFLPMPTVVIGTLTDNNTTSLGSYSLVQPYYIAGKDYYAMLLCARNSSNTAQNLLKNKTCSINFLPNNKKYMKEAIRLGIPGETSKDKMKDCIFNLGEGERAKEDFPNRYPKIIKESYQVFECTWMSDLDGAELDAPGSYQGYDAPYHDFNGITSKHGAHFILKIDKILVNDKYQKSILNNVKASQINDISIPYGYHPIKSFFYPKFKRSKDLDKFYKKYKNTTEK